MIQLESHEDWDHEPTRCQILRGRIIRGERVLQYVVWDGVHDYENAPPLQGIALVEKM